MKYEPIIARLEEKYPKDQRFGLCYDVSKDLALLILSEFSGHRVSTVQGLDLSKGPVWIFANHYVTVVQEPEGKFVALDATRPSYESGEDYWAFEANSEEELEALLSGHYTGIWRIQDKWLDKVPK